jgi:hypothetical protein
MPRWLTGLLVLLLILVFIVPNPAAAGNTAGNWIDSLVVFVRSAGNEVGGTLTASQGSSGGGSGGSGSARTAPYGGVASGDGSYRMAPVDLSAVQAVVAPPPAPGGALDTAAEGTLPQSRPVKLQIPAIGVSVGFVSLGLQPDGTMEVPNSAHQAGWYRGASTPGARGPAVVTAHVDWLQEKGVFHDLARVRPGDEVTVDRTDGATAVFGVTRIEQYPKSQFPADEVYGDTDGAELRLITCGGHFDHATHSYSDNVVVYARMVRVS